MVIVDHVLRYEHLTDDLARLFERYAVPFDGELGVRAKGDYRTDRRPYREMYTDAEAAIVAEEFEKEIVLNGYSF